MKRAFLVLLQVLGLVLVAACAAPPGPSEDRSELPVGQLFTDQPLLVVPERTWSLADPAADGAVWTMRSLGPLFVYVHQPPADLSFTFEAAGRTVDYAFEATWDDEPLVGMPTPAAPGVLHVEVPAERLTPGRHVLRLDRVARWRKVPEGPDNEFRRIAWTSGGSSHELRPERAERYRQLADFLSAGLAGAGPQRRAGFLFDGGREVVAEVTLAAPARLRVFAENLSDDAATFVLGQAESAVTGSREVKLQPGAGELLELELPAGAPKVVFRTEGQGDGLFLWGAPRLLRPDAGKTPIVLLTLDTTRRDALGVYNGQDALTPNLDALAARSDVFDNAHSTAPWTLPSHTSMMTGLYPSRHGTGLRTQIVFDHTATLAGLLGDAGYLSAGFAGGDLCSYRFGVGQGFDLYRDPDGFETRGDRQTAHVEEFLERRAGEPFFLFANYFDAHGGYHAPEENQRNLGVPQLAERLAGQPEWQALADGEGAALARIARGSAESSAEGRAYLRATYLAEVQYMDAQIGRLFAELKRRDLFDRALVVVTADHGELLGEHGAYGHAGRLDHELTEVPLLVKWPGQTEGRRLDQLASGVDVFATVLHAAGIDAPPSDGVVLTPEALDASGRSHVYLEEHQSRVHPLDPQLRLGAHLFGVQRPSARQVVWDSERQGGQLCEEREDGRWHRAPCSLDRATLMAHLEAALAPRNDPEEGGEDALSDEDLEALKALGYL